jgi:protein-S-isoprenylcysteine O-methyltransferase Ste14
MAWTPLLVAVVSALDERYGWSPPVPMSLSIVAAVAGVTGALLTLWAMASNRFFSGLVRIQTERGHTVASAGPYGFVRHPGYVGATLFSVLAPLMLGSLWAFLPALAGLTACIIRTSLEDRTLQAELPGYAAYAQRVRHRLMPGVW